MATRKQIIELLKSGDFTIVYNNSDACDLHKGRYKSYEAATYDKKIDDFKEPFHQFDSDRDGYEPEIVKLLVEALTGKSYSI